jgi:hypothetical protein
MKTLLPRTQFFALCVLLAACAPEALGQRRPPAWQEFTSADGEFTAKFLAKPTVSQEPFRKGPLDFVRHVHSAIVPGRYTFKIAYVDYPPGYTDAELSIEGGVNSLARTMTEKGGRVLTNAPVTRGTCEGRETTVVLPNPSTGGEGFAQGRIFFSGQRYYLLLFVSEADGAAARRVGQTFVDSFDIKRGCPKEAAPEPAPLAALVERSVEGTPDSATGWRRIESAEHGFGVLMPGASQLESEQTHAQPIALWHHTYSHETPDVIYTAEIMGDYPPNFHNGPGAYQYLLDITALTVKRNLEPLGYTITPGRDLKLGEFPGREYRVENASQKAEGRAQLFATPRRLYIFMALTLDRSPAAAADIERFFSSVRIFDK